MTKPKRWTWQKPEPPLTDSLVESRATGRLELAYVTTVEDRYVVLGMIGGPDVEITRAEFRRDWRIVT